MIDLDFPGSVSRETRERLEAYRALLEKWNPKINLVAPSSLTSSGTRHFIDSAQLDPLAPEAVSWIDLGSGGGFPGLVIAAMRKGSSTGFDITLVESDVRKCAFLREAARVMDLQVKILNSRAESISGNSFDVVSARALASLQKLLTLAEPLLKPSGCCLFLKGASFEDEVDAARKEWHFSLEAIPSVTSPDGMVLKIKDLRRV